MELLTPGNWEGQKQWVHHGAQGLLVGKDQGKGSSRMIGRKKWLPRMMPTIKTGSPHIKSKCWVECSSSCHNNTSSTSVWANGSLDLYLTSGCSVMRTCCILYLTLNQYYQKLSLIPWSIKLICIITLHRPLWEHLVNRRAGRGTHLFKGSSTTLWMVVDITQIIPCLHEMHKS
jgi:hypothetical protein